MVIKKRLFLHQVLTGATIQRRGFAWPNMKARDIKLQSESTIVSVDV